jgi:hypothetical protein
MIRRNVWCLLLIVACSASGAFAQKADEPAEDSPEGVAIQKALSVPVSRDLTQEITFSIDTFNVQGNWAFVGGKARDAKGAEPNWKVTKYQSFIDNNDFEDNLFALLKKTDGKWEVVTYMMNCHDVCYLEWARKYKAPKAIIR